MHGLSLCCIAKMQNLLCVCLSIFPVLLFIYMCMYTFSMYIWRCMHVIYVAYSQRACVCVCVCVCTVSCPVGQQEPPTGQGPQVGQDLGRLDTRSTRREQHLDRRRTVSSAENSLDIFKGLGALQRSIVLHFCS